MRKTSFTMKTRLLRKLGFRYVKSKDLFFHRKYKTLVSFEFVLKHPIGKLQTTLTTPKKQIYFIRKPSQEVTKYLMQVANRATKPKKRKPRRKKCWHCRGEGKRLYFYTTGCGTTEFTGPDPCWQCERTGWSNCHTPGLCMSDSCPNAWHPEES